MALAALPAGVARVLQARVDKDGEQEGGEPAAE